MNRRLSFSPATAPNLAHLRGRSAVAGGTVLLLIVLALVFALPRVRFGATIPAARALYVSDSQPWASETVRLRPLDPRTLADAADLPALEFGRDASWAFSTAWDLSKDGSTFVSLKYGWDDTAAISSNRPASTIVVVREARTGAERLRFHLPGRALPGKLSQDGSRLVIRLDGGAAVSPWQVYDTATGRVLLATSDNVSGSADGALDVDGSRLFFLSMADGSTGPRPVQLVGYDLTAGTEIGRLPLPDVRGGSWTTNRWRDGMPVRESAAPGVALSPDGHRLAVVDADASSVTLIDADQPRVERTISLARSTALTTWLPFLPDRAYAKENVGEGAMAGVVFSSDGSRLYVYGSATTVDDHEAIISRSAGLQVVDLAHGVAGARTLDDVDIDQVLPAPDGPSIYVVADASGGPDPYVLLRLDGVSLATIAQRGIRSPSLWLAAGP